MCPQLWINLIRLYLKYCAVDVQAVHGICIATDDFMRAWTAAWKLVLSIEKSLDNFEPCFNLKQPVARAAVRCYKVVTNASSGSHVPFVVVTWCSWLGLCCWMLLWNGKPVLREIESMVFHACVCCFHLYSAFAESSCCLYDIPLKKFKEMKRKMICSYFIWCFLS